MNVRNNKDTPSTPLRFNWAGPVINLRNARKVRDKGRGEETKKTRGGPDKIGNGKKEKRNHFMTPHDYRNV